jgi:hypothetical protein
MRLWHDTDAIVDAICDMIGDYFDRRNITPEKAVEIYDSILYLLESLDDESDAVYCYDDQFYDSAENDMYYY